MNMKHNAYDFDKTIYKGDATLDFYFYCIKRHPIILLEIPRNIGCFFLYLFGLCSKKRFKENFFRFLKHIESIDDELAHFWDAHKSKIAAFYLAGRNENDIIISASPEFLLAPICGVLNIRNLIASKVDKVTGIYDGENCWGKEKLRRLAEEMPEAEIANFYSDSLSDAPMAEAAENAHMVKKDKIMAWSAYETSAAERLAKTYYSKEFTLFVFCGGMGTLTNFLCSLAISTRLDPTIAYIFGYSMSLFVAYALNASLIYRQRYEFGRFIKFAISYIPNFLILFAFVFAFLNMLHWNKVVVYALAGMLGLPVTYILVKLYAFGKIEE